MKQKIRNEKLILFAILLIVLLTYPFIAIVNKPFLVMGIPILYFYIFLVWLIAIVIIKRLADKKNSTKDFLRSFVHPLFFSHNETKEIKNTMRCLVVTVVTLCETINKINF